MFCFGIYCIFALVFACSDRSNRKQDVFRDDNNLSEKRQKRYPGIYDNAVVPQTTRLMNFYFMSMVEYFSLSALLSQHRKCGQYVNPKSHRGMRLP